jgi:hypothetical protein
MTEQWPSCKVADDAVVQALGVMNINFVRFEATQVYMPIIPRAPPARGQ